MAVDILTIYGIGKGQDALLIGGGESVKGFQIPKDICKIGINWTPGIEVQYRIYQDKLFMDDLMKSSGNGSFVIGHSRNMCPRTHYFYDERHVDIGNHTGYIALQIADKIMGFKNIYLIGFDYRKGLSGFHYFGDDKHEYWIQWNSFLLKHEDYFKRDIQDFDRMEWDAKIFNCNLKSKLRRFPFCENISVSRTTNR